MAQTIKSLIRQMKNNLASAKKEHNSIRIKIESDINRMDELKDVIIPRLTTSLSVLEESFAEDDQPQEEGSSAWTNEVKRLVKSKNFSASGLCMLLQTKGYSPTKNQVVHWLTQQKKQGLVKQPKKSQWKLVK